MRQCVITRLLENDMSFHMGCFKQFLNMNKEIKIAN